MTHRPRIGFVKLEPAIDPPEILDEEELEELEQAREDAEELKFEQERDRQMGI